MSPTGGASFLYENNNSAAQKIYPRGVSLVGFLSGASPGTTDFVDSPARPVPPNHYYRMTSLTVSYGITATAPVMQNVSIRIMVYGDKIPLFFGSTAIGSSIQNHVSFFTYEIPLNLIISNNMRASISATMNYGGGGVGSRLGCRASVNGYLKATKLSLAWGANTPPTPAEVRDILFEYIDW